MVFLRLAHCARRASEWGLQRVINNDAVNYASDTAAPGRGLLPTLHRRGGFMINCTRAVAPRPRRSHRLIRFARAHLQLRIGSNLNHRMNARTHSNAVFVSSTFGILRAL